MRFLDLLAFLAFPSLNHDAVHAACIYLHSAKNRPPHHPSSALAAKTRFLRCLARLPLLLRSVSTRHQPQGRRQGVRRQGRPAELRLATPPPQAGGRPGPAVHRLHAGGRPDLVINQPSPPAGRPSTSAVRAESPKLRRVFLLLPGSPLAELLCFCRAATSSRNHLAVSLPLVVSSPPVCLSGFRHFAGARVLLWCAFMALPGLSFSPGLGVQNDVCQSFGLSVTTAPLSSDSFALVVSFG